MKNYSNLFDLKGKRVLITGAGRLDGIGANIALALADFGAHIAFHDFKEAEDVIKIKQSILEKGVECQFFESDLSIPSAGNLLIDNVIHNFGNIDIVILNASYQVVGDFLNVTQDDIDIQLNVNFRANIEILQKILPMMADNGWGRIINIGSINQRSPKAIVSVYAAAKAAQHNLIMSLSRDYAKYGVLLNSISPGLIDTYPKNRLFDKEASTEWEKYTENLNWLGRSGQPEEIVGAAIFLSSNSSSFMTGETIFIAGGG